MEEREWLKDVNGFEYYIDPETHNKMHKDGGSSGISGISGHSEGYGKDGEYIPPRYLNIHFKNTKESEEFYKEVDDYLTFGPKYEKWMIEHGQKP